METTASDTSLGEVVQWIKQMGERGLYHPTSARNRVTALERLSSVLAEDEPQNAEYLRDNVEALCDRWTLLEGANPDTARTYLSRARVALNDFFEYRRDPRAFKPRGRAPRGEKPAKREPSVPKEAEARPAVAGGGSNADGQSLRSFPVAGGEFLYRLPSSVTVADVTRIAYHLVTFAEDFDATEMPPFSKVTGGNRQE